MAGGASWQAPSLSSVAVHKAPVVHIVDAAVVVPHVHGYIELLPPVTLEQTRTPTCVTMMV